MKTIFIGLIATVVLQSGIALAQGMKPQLTSSIVSEYTAGFGKVLIHLDGADNATVEFDENECFGANFEVCNLASTRRVPGRLKVIDGRILVLISQSDESLILKPIDSQNFLIQQIDGKSMKLSRELKAKAHVRIQYLPQMN